MSLYNMLFGVDKMAPVLLAALGIKTDQVPRFRDCFLDSERKHIVIHTRTGGGNRDYYANAERYKAHHADQIGTEYEYKGPWNDDLHEHANYLYDEDDDFDSTYADFYFSFPTDYVVDLTALCDKVETYRPSNKWQALFRSLKS